MQPAGVVALPYELSSSVGGGQQIAAVVARLRAGRLVTLTGTGGIGKTRLALRVARQLHTADQHCTWVDLSAIDSRASIADLVAAALIGGQPTHCTTTDALISSIGNHQLLLVLDNCEHLISACADLVVRMLQACGGVRVLATSREPLGVAGENVYFVEPLSLPRPDEPRDRQLQSEAMQLFLERARARSPLVCLSDESLENAARICRSVNGVPLAIELAAARTSSMTVAEIADRLHDVLGLLVLGPRTAAQRQQTMRASVEWSHALLQPDEQRLLRRLALFDGDFAVEDAQATNPFDDMRGAAVAVLVDRLVAQSMLIATEHDARMRFCVPPPVRQYCLEQLAVADEPMHRDCHPAGASESAAARVDSERGDAPAARHDATRSGHARRTTALSDRERAVVALIAGGRSNRQIADELVITKKTAEAHVSHILTKLGLCSRVQIATWCLEQGLN
jgi:predicted ATPase